MLVIPLASIGSIPIQPRFHDCSNLHASSWQYPLTDVLCTESKNIGGNMKRLVALAPSTVAAYCGICSAQKCPIGSESKIDAG
jgi:hypothetical protein